jgi:DNA/RNA-binding domain of Phe-tRNA-synthetase-like protein
MYFQYDGSVLDKFPTIRGGVIWANVPDNCPSSPVLQEAYAVEQQATLQRLGNTPLSDLPSLNAWRRVFSSFGVKPTQYRNAAEALLRRLTKQGEIPSINTLVDIGNLVSIRYALPVAILDTNAIKGGLTVRLANGTERFTDLHAEEAEHPEPGEVIFVDEAGAVHARRWCWRQSSQSAANPTTSTVLITIEGHHPSAQQDVQAATEDLLRLLSQVGVQQSEHAQLSPQTPRFLAQNE